MAGVEQRRVAELTWTFRPEPGRPAEVQALAGTAIHATASLRADGEVEVVLQGGTRVRAKPAEMVAE